VLLGAFERRHQASKTTIKQRTLLPTPKKMGTSRWVEDAQHLGNTKKEPTHLSQVGSREHWIEHFSLFFVLFPCGQVYT
jgi:hypothetical protein